MTTPAALRALLVPLAMLGVAACGSEPPPTAIITDPPAGPAVLQVLGRGNFKPARVTGEVAVRGTTAYTTTWGNSSAAASVFYIWDVSADVPALVDSVKVDNATTLGDVAISDDGALLVVATERTPGSIVLYSLADPRRPVLLSRFANVETNQGVHTAEIGRVNGTLYGFLSIDPGGGLPAKLVTVNLSNPAAPVQVFSQFIGSPYVHDTFVRNGLLFLALWNDGVAIWDIGGGGKGGTPAAPVELGRVRTAGGEVHNVAWVRDRLSGSFRYAFIGQEGPGTVGASSTGDIHVVDVSNLAAPREVAFYTVAGAGTHNFSVDEGSAYLHAAYYNGGVRTLDIEGNLEACTAEQKSTPAGSATPLCDLRKMGREKAVGLLNQGNPVFVWGVQYQDGALYASDMLNGLWKIRAITRGLPSPD